MVYSANDEAQKSLVSLNGVYAHGSLETTLGYDIMKTGDFGVAAEYYSVKNSANNVNKKKKITHTKAKSPSGEEVDIQMYMWTADGQMRGLAVDLADLPSVKYALQQFKDNAAHL